MDSLSVRLVSDCFIWPRQVVEESKKPIHLTPWDLQKLSRHYIQKGLLFLKPREAYTREDFMESFLEKLKDSLSIALIQFYPLAGRLKTVRSDDPHLYAICIDCINSPGVRLIYATLDITVAGILSLVYVPQVVQSFFDHNRAVNHDGYTRSLMSIQVTELVDGVFIGCSFNHAVGDGTSYWNFFNTWSEIFQAREKGNRGDVLISHMPVLRRWFPEGCEVPVNLPFRDPSEFIAPYESPVLKERIFHFSAETILQLKETVNKECGTRSKDAEISSFKALAAVVWRSIIRARGFQDDQVTSFTMSANFRARMCEPGLPPEYFGNCTAPVKAHTTTGVLLGSGLGTAARLLHVALAEHRSKRIHDSYLEWLQNPAIYSHGQSYDSSGIWLSSSPRFNKYRPEFGLGKAVAARSGYANKLDGNVAAYPGREGVGSIDLEICLSPETMAALEADAEFMAAVVV